MRLLFLTAVISFMCSTCYAHSGRTDSAGGHNDRIHGGYHYHNGGYSRSRYTPKTTYRSGARTRSSRSSRSSARSTKPKTRFRSTVRSSTYSNALYIEVDLSKETAKAEEEYCLMEVSSKSEIEANQRLKLYVVEKGFIKSSLEGSESAVKDEMARMVRESGITKNSAKVYLNGMSSFHTSWAHCEPFKDLYGIWIRDVNSTEFNKRKLHGLSHEFRIWHDKTEKFSINAALLYINKEEVALLTKSGRKRVVKKSILCDEDLEYLGG